MNQNNSSIEEIVEDFITRFSVNIADVKTTKELAKYWIRKTLLELNETHHQELQKAREEKFVDGMIAATQWLIDNGHLKAGKDLNEMMLKSLVHQSELDQPNIIPNPAFGVDIQQNTLNPYDVRVEPTNKYK